jgi:LAO/AO transport system kinase
MPDELLDRFRQHDRLALSRLLSLVSRGAVAETLVAQLGPLAKRSRVVALTGAGGVGKSTLVGKLIEHVRKQGQTVAVLACDPQSPLSGGALLGDRFRMPSQPDDGVFIRSLVAASGRGPLAEHLETMVRLLEAYGFDLVLIETAGAGQGDTAVRELTDGVVLLLQPEAGDDLQWEKAGLIEVADAIAVNKADLPGADQAAAQVRAALSLVAGCREVPVLLVSAKTGQGVPELAQTISTLPLKRKGPAKRPVRMRSYKIDDPITDPLTDNIEVTIEFEDGSRRWLFFATPAHLASVGDWIPGTQVRMHLGERHMIVVGQLNEVIVDKVLKELDAQGELESHSLELQ